MPLDKNNGTLLVLGATTVLVAASLATRGLRGSRAVAQGFHSYMFDITLFGTVRVEAVTAQRARTLIGEFSHDFDLSLWADHDNRSDFLKPGESIRFGSGDLDGSADLIDEEDGESTFDLKMGATVTVTAKSEQRAKVIVREFTDPFDLGMVIEGRQDLRSGERLAFGEAYLEGEPDLYEIDGQSV